MRLGVTEFRLGTRPVLGRRDDGIGGGGMREEGTIA